ncbi:MAG: hypothetical protein MUC95_05535 [Spirochaetes bacterium]|nr:hypothetical protein [Spirochaetota bacterium]
MADWGMEYIVAVLKSRAITRPLAAYIFPALRAPLHPMPVSTTPILLSPNVFAALLNSGSAAGLTWFSGGSSRS